MNLMTYLPLKELSPQLILTSTGWQMWTKNPPHNHLQSLNFERKTWQRRIFYAWKPHTSDLHFLWSSFYIKSGCPFIGSIYTDCRVSSSNAAREYLGRGNQVSFMYPRCACQCSGVDGLKWQFAHLEEHYSKGEVKKSLFKGSMLCCQSISLSGSEKCYFL